MASRDGGGNVQYPSPILPHTGTGYEAIDASRQSPSPSPHLMNQHQHQQQQQRDSQIDHPYMTSPTVLKEPPYEHYGVPVQPASPAEAHNAAQRYGVPVYVEAPPIPTPQFQAKRYRILYGWDCIAIVTSLVALWSFGILIPFIWFTQTWWWWWWCIFWVLILLCFIYAMIDQLPSRFERKSSGYEVRNCCFRHFIPFNEIAYLRVINGQTGLTLCDSMQGGRTSVCCHEAVQIKSFRAGSSIIFTPKMGANEFLRENIPNESLSNYAIERDATEASLTYVH